MNFTAMNNHHLEHRISGNASNHIRIMDWENGIDAYPSTCKLPPPTKFQGRNPGNTKTTKSIWAQGLESDKRQLECSHQILGRNIAREEAARWSCSAEELEEISASVADVLLMLMRPKL
jgi:hypothetical protein